jgi:hypothetical protein
MGWAARSAAVPHDLGSEFRNGSVKVSRFRQIKEFTFHHNTVRKGVNDRAFGCSVGTSDFDGMVSQRLDNSSDVFGSPREAKQLHLVSFDRDHYCVISRACISRNTYVRITTYVNYYVEFEDQI